MFLKISNTILGDFALEISIASISFPFAEPLLLWKKHMGLYIYIIQTSGIKPKQECVKKKQQQLCKPYLVSASVRLMKDMETARLQVQLVNVDTELPVLRAHSG